MVTVINTQAKSITVLEEKLLTKANDHQISDSYSRISDSFNFTDPDLSKLMLAQQKEKPLPELTGDLIQDNSNRICNKVGALSLVIETIYKKNKDWETKLNKVENECAKKVSKEEVKEKLGKTKRKINTNMEDFKNKLNKKVDDIDKKIGVNMSQLEILVKDVEKKTIWKIQDCEALLQKRINNEYVDSSCKNLEDRLRKEVRYY